MGRISSDVGLVTGLPIKETVDKLIAIQARRRDLVAAANSRREAQQLAITALSAQFLGLQIAARKLGNINVFDRRVTSSSNSAAISVSLSGQAALGNYQVTPLATVGAHQILGSGLTSRSAPLGPGTFSFSFGGFLDADTGLDLLGGGSGFRPGRIRITDRLGNSGDIDLRHARTVDDVLRAINENGAIDVTADLAGDRIRLVDHTGASVANLRVRDLDATGTAASLGLAGIDVAANTALGDDVVRLFEGLNLERLNDGRGLRLDRFLPDLRVSLRDGGPPVVIDFLRQGTAPASISGTTVAAAGPEARVLFRAAQASQELVGVSIHFENDDGVTAGGETVVYDPQSKTLTFKIDEGHTTSGQIVAALARDADASQFFQAQVLAGSSGGGLISVGDTTVLDGPRSQATTPGTLDPHARLTLRATTSGPELDETKLEFVDDPGVTAGGELVSLHLPTNTITVRIAAGQSTAAHVVDALNAHPLVSAAFTASLAAGSNGSGLISTDDTTYTSGGAVVSATSERTLGDLLATINAAAPGRLRAEISTDGDRIQLVDLSTDLGGTFAVASLPGSHAAEDLGFDAPAAGGTLVSRRLLAGLNTTLVASLNAGRGLGPLGVIQLTDRSGAAASVDLAGAETVYEILDRLNQSGIGIAARLNQARNGIELIDTTGAAGNLTVADGDPTGTATVLGLAIDAAAARVNGGSLARQTVGRHTLLADLNGGRGVADGSFTITDTNGASRVFTFVGSQVTTVGDLIDEINGLDLAIEARLNDAGNGIALVDTAEGAAALTVAATGGRTAADLHLTSPARQVEIEGQATWVIDGDATVRVEIDADDSLDDLVAKLNALGQGVTASVLNDGTLGAPFRLSLLSNQAGTRGELSVDSGNLNLAFQEVVRARDALIQIGGASGVLVSSRTNEFKEAIAGLTLRLGQAGTAPVTIHVNPNDAEFTAAVKDVVDRYNALVAKLKEVGDPEKGVLKGSSTLLRLQSEMAGLVTRRFTGTGSITTLQSIGIQLFQPVIDPLTGIVAEESLAQSGTLTLDSERLAALFAGDREALKTLFTTAASGVAARFDRLVNQLVASETSVLFTRQFALSRQIADANSRIEFLNAQLERNRTRLTEMFVRAEQAIAKITSNQSALTTLSNLATQLSIINANR